jgi:DNA recombination protein RmuC
MDFLFLAIGLVLGAVVIFFYTKTQNNGPLDTTELDNLRQQNQNLQNNLSRSEERASQLAIQQEEYKHELNGKRQQVLELSTQLTARETDLTNLRQRLDEQKAEVEQLQQKFAIEFKNIANEILEDKSRRFTETNKTNIGEILNPLQEKIKEFERKVDDTHKASIVTSAELRNELKMLHDLNKTMTKETENLTKALKGDNKAQGNWGEMILEKVLERSGLVKDREYFIQTSYTTEDGKRYQPDVIVKLPEGRNVVVDSKVSLIDYERCGAAENDDDRIIYLKAHINSLRSHIKGLSEKQYQNIYELSGLDFVLLFIPIEPAFSIAVQQDSELYTYALDRNIVLVTPSTLLATLKTIANIWRHDNQNKNALEIAQQSGALYDKFVGLADSLIKVGKKIDESKSEYVDAMGKLTEGKGNLIGRVERLKEMGAKTTKSLPQGLLDRAGVEKELTAGEE